MDGEKDGEKLVTVEGLSKAGKNILKAAAYTFLPDIILPTSDKNMIVAGTVTGQALSLVFMAASGFVAASSEFPGLDAQLLKVGLAGYGVSKFFSLLGRAAEHYVNKSNQGGFRTE